MPLGYSQQMFIWLRELYLTAELWNRYDLAFTLQESSKWMSYWTWTFRECKKRRGINLFLGWATEPIYSGTVNTDSTQWDSTYSFFPFKDSKRRKMKPSLFHKVNRLIFPSVLAQTFDKIRNQYKGNKIRITLLIEYLKTRILFEIWITPQARSIMSSLNNSCWLNIWRQEHLLEIRITPQARLIMSSLNDSTCNLNYIELQRNLAIG